MAHHPLNIKPKIVKSYADIHLSDRPVVCLGNFDGVHLGHQSVIQNCLAEAKRQRSSSMIFSFDPHPSEVLLNRIAKPITSYDERIALLSLFNVDLILMQKFDLEFSQLTAEYFINEILVKHLNAKSIVVGREFHFGNKALGNISTLRADGRFEVIECSSVNLDGRVVSSSNIRKALEVKELDWAEKALSYPYFVGGTVKHGDQRGRTIGFPTANIEVTKKIILPFGVYACVLCDIKTNQAFSGMVNWGTKPTFEKQEPGLEVSLFNFNDNLYGREVRIFFYDFIRDQKKFTDIEYLKKELNSDMQKVQSILISKDIFHPPELQQIWSLSYPDSKLQWFQQLDISKI